MAKEREIPYCSICLVVSCILCHVAVLVGNLSFAETLDVMGDSTNGWSGVGIGLGSSLQGELDTAMGNVTVVLTNVINQVMQVQNSVDSVMGIAGTLVQEAIQEYQVVTQSVPGATSAVGGVSGGAGAGTAASLLSLSGGHIHHGAVAPSLPAPHHWGPPSEDLYFSDESFFALGQLNVSVVDAGGAVPPSPAPPPQTRSKESRSLLAASRASAAALAETKPVVVREWTPGAVKLFALAATYDMGTRGGATQLPGGVGNQLPGSLGNMSLSLPSPALPLSTQALQNLISQVRAQVNQALQGVNPQQAAQTFLNSLQNILGNVVTQLTNFISTTLQQFLDMVMPALTQVGVWLQTFSQQVSSLLADFSVTIDRVQKVFDQLMSQFASGGQGEEQMLYDTYTLFDASNTGAITLTDLQNASTIYGIQALSGNSSYNLLNLYDVNNDGNLTQDEYANFVHDPSIPGAMPTVLRAYAKQLSIISGNLAAAQLRDEVASAVVAYLSLVCAKNQTKVGWVSDRLTNGSLPMNFTADVLKNLADQVNNPVQVTTVDVGQVIVTAMMGMQPNYVVQCLNLMADPVFWQNEGFDPTTQAATVQQVTVWVNNFTATTNSTTLSLEAQSGEVSLGVFGTKVVMQPFSAIQSASSHDHRDFPQKMFDLVQERSKLHLVYTMQQRHLRTVALYGSQASVHLMNTLLSGTPASSASATDPALQMAMGAGQPAANSTLQFASWLANNASATASTFQNQCFQYSKTSSTAVDNFATQIQTMIGQIMSFLNVMSQYASPTGIQQVEGMVTNFTNDAAQQVLSQLMNATMQQLQALIPNLPSSVQVPVVTLPPSVNSTLNSTLGAINSNLNGSLGNGSVGSGISGGLSGVLGGSQLAASSAAEVQALRSRSLQTPTSSSVNASSNNMTIQAPTSGVFALMSQITNGLQLQLPGVIQNVNGAKTKIQSVSSTLTSIFTVFQSSGPPIFQQVSTLYQVVWIAYFAFFTVLTTSILFYAFWASGFMGGPQATEVGNYEPPRTLRQRCAVCCAACNTCMKACHDSQLCFWSFVILMQVFVLVLFVITIVLCIVMGVKAFLGAGCSQIYILGDPVVCTGMLNTIRGMLQTFLGVDNTALDNYCDSADLLTCQLIAKKAGQASVLMIIGSLLSSVLSFQMIMDSAMMHERARWKRMINEELKEA